jgi:hypothetical protein
MGTNLGGLGLWGGAGVENLVLVLIVLSKEMMYICTRNFSGAAKNPAARFDMYLDFRPTRMPYTKEAPREPPL